MLDIFFANESLENPLKHHRMLLSRPVIHRSSARWKTVFTTSAYSLGSSVIQMHHYISRYISWSILSQATDALSPLPDIANDTALISIEEWNIFAALIKQRQLIKGKSVHETRKSATVALSLCRHRSCMKVFGHIFPMVGCNHVDTLTANSEWTRDV